MGKELLEFSIIEEGGKFVAQESLKKHLSSVIKCVANFVDFGDGSNRYTTFDSDVYKVLPKIFVDIANNSRIDSGYRLLMRCVRHAVDSKSNKIDCAKFVINSDGKIILILQNNVPASMRNNVYNTYCAIDEDGVLVACKCDCQCGSVYNERVTCVHVLPIAYQFSMFLVECLAEHMLLELAAICGSENIISSMTEENQSIMMKGVKLLIGAGSTLDEVTSMDDKSLNDLLHTYSVGTEKRKNINVGVIPVDQLGPIRNISKMSTVHKAAFALQQLCGKVGKTKKNSNVNFDNNINGKCSIFDMYHLLQMSNPNFRLYSSIILSDDIKTYNPDWMLVQSMINSLPSKVDDDILITCSGIHFVCNSNLI